MQKTILRSPPKRHVYFHQGTVSATIPSEQKKRKMADDKKIHEEEPGEVVVVDGNGGNDGNICKLCNIRCDKVTK
jgi:hypothetical protein